MIIVALCGLPGAGKTVLTQDLKETLSQTCNIVCVCFDDIYEGIQQQQLNPSEFKAESWKQAQEDAYEFTKKLLEDGRMHNADMSR